MPHEQIAFQFQYTSFQICRALDTLETLGTYILHRPSKCENILPLYIHLKKDKVPTINKYIAILPWSVSKNTYE